MDISDVKPPYYAVIFTSRLSNRDGAYEKMAEKMLTLAAKQEGFPGAAAHLEAHQRGREEWYTHYRVQVCRVEREYGFEATIEP